MTKREIQAAEHRAESELAALRDSKDAVISICAERVEKLNAELADLRKRHGDNLESIKTLVSEKAVAWKRIKELEGQVTDYIKQDLDVVDVRWRFPGMMDMPGGPKWMERTVAQIFDECDEIAKILEKHEYLSAAQVIRRWAERIRTEMDDKARYLRWCSDHLTPIEPASTRELLRMERNTLRDTVHSMDMQRANQQRDLLYANERVEKLKAELAQAQKFLNQEITDWAATDTYCRAKAAEVLPEFEVYGDKESVPPIEAIVDRLVECVSPKRKEDRAGVAVTRGED